MASSWLLPVFAFFIITKVDGLQYELFKVEKTWDEARVHCSENNMRLVQVNEHLEHTRIKNYNPFVFNHFWIGLKREDSQFKWRDESVAEFTAWGENQPQTRTDCVRYSANNFQWETHNCSAQLFFMCEKAVAEAKKSGSSTMAAGVMIGLGAMLGLLLLGILLLQLPCCRVNTVKAFGQFGLGK